MRARATVVSRFEKLYIPEPNSGCWLWAGSGTNAGYGTFYLGGGRANAKWTTAHRMAYRLYVGPIPKGREIDHLCRVRCCVNPSHLEAVTPSLNQARTPNARINRTHCPKGHPYEGYNLFVTSEGHRQCRACRKAHSKAYRNRKRNGK